MATCLFSSLFGGFFDKKTQNETIIEANKEILAKDEEDFLKLQMLEQYVKQLNIDSYSSEKIVKVIRFEIEYAEMSVHRRLGKETFDKKLEDLKDKYK